MNEARSDGAGLGAPIRSAARRPIADRVLGIAGTLLIVLGVGFALAQLVAGAARAGPPIPGEGAPQLRVVQPTSGAESDSPLDLVFETPAPLVSGPMGWQAGSLHLHAEVNGREVMPGARDIARLGAGRYRWHLRVPAGGEVEIRLFWAGTDHRPLEEGASPLVRVSVR
jgi:hypothetical protein